MKNIYLMLISFVFLTSCGGESRTSTQLPPTSTNVPVLLSQPEPLSPQLYALFSDLAYCTEGIAIPEGWVEIRRSRGTPARSVVITSGEIVEVAQVCDEDSLGFFGVAYLNEATGQEVITYAGTNFPKDFNFLADLFGDDLLIASGQDPEQYSSALRFYNDVVANNPVGSVSEITFTGHSLGALLAEMVAAHVNSKAVTFDSPGSYPMIYKMLEVKGYSEAEILQRISTMDISTYFNEPNIINAANRHVGKMILLNPNWKDTWAKYAGKLTPQYIPMRGYDDVYTSPTYLVVAGSYTFGEAHRLGRIREALSQNTSSWIDVDSWWPRYFLSRLALLLPSSIPDTTITAIDPSMYNAYSQLENGGDLSNKLILINGYMEGVAADSTPAFAAVQSAIILEACGADNQTCIDEALATCFITSKPEDFLACLYAIVDQTAPEQIEPTATTPLESAEVLCEVWIGSDNQPVYTEPRNDSPTIEETLSSYAVYPVIAEEINIYRTLTWIQIRFPNGNTGWVIATSDIVAGDCPLTRAHYPNARKLIMGMPRWPSSDIIYVCIITASSPTDVYLGDTGGIYINEVVDTIGEYPNVKMLVWAVRPDETGTIWLQIDYVFFRYVRADQVNVVAGDCSKNTHPFFSPLRVIEECDYWCQHLN
jgi:hypothetical protein